MVGFNEGQEKGLTRTQVQSTPSVIYLVFQAVQENLRHQKAQHSQRNAR